LWAASVPCPPSLASVSTPIDPSRRDLLKGAAIAGAGLALGASALPAQDAVDDVPLRSLLDRPSAADTMAGVPFAKHETVRIAIVGTGLRGRSVLHELLGVPNVRITALCDTVPEKVEMAARQLREAGHTHEPARFTSGPRAYEQLVQRDDIDIVYTATPWEWHVPVVLAAMNAGKHAATEVPAGLHARGLLDAGGRVRAHAAALPDDGELQLRLQRVAGPQHGAGRRLRADLHGLL
jgi:hypothetical protein